MLWHFDITKATHRRIVPSLLWELTARYRTIVDYAARHYLDTHWYAHTVTPQMHHERTTSTCISVSHDTILRKHRKRERALRARVSYVIRLAAHSTAYSIDPQNSRRRRRDDAPTAVPSTWRSVFVRRMRRVSWTIADR